MRKVKAMIAMALVSCMLASLAACGGGETPPPAGGSSGAAGSAAPGNTEMAEQKWAKDNNLDKTETVEELYLKAKEEGKVVIYSISSRTKKVKASFEKQYPDIECEPFDISTNELLEKITREYESGVRNCDVIHIKEQTGSIKKEYLDTGIFHAYQPSDICNTIDPQYLSIATPLYFEEAWWFYNDEVNPDGPPIKSWWDLTRPEWKGRFLFSDPTGNQGYMALLTSMVQNADMMEKNYEEVFGEKLVLSEGCENAGYEFIKRFAQNQPMFESSSGKIVENVGIRGQKTAPVGYAASSKIREREEQNWALQSIYDFEPAVAIIGMNTLNIVNEAPHPNAAKLLVRWMMGEADGKGEGFEPFNTVGGWSARSNVPLADGNPKMEDTKLFPMDYDYVYDHIQDVSDFWLTVQP